MQSRQRFPSPGMFVGIIFLAIYRPRTSLKHVQGVVKKTNFCLAKLHDGLLIGKVAHLGSREETRQRSVNGTEQTAISRLLEIPGNSPYSQHRVSERLWKLNALNYCTFFQQWTEIIQRSGIQNRTMMRRLHQSQPNFSPKRL